MSALSWGKPKIEISKLDASGNPISWIELDTPVENTSKLVPQKGAKKEAKLEGGSYADIKYLSNNYGFECELYNRKGKSKPIVDFDGVISDNYAMRLTPEDSKMPGFTLPKCVVSLEPTWDAESGEKWKYTFEALQPDDGGEKCRPFNSLTVDKNALSFASAADAVGKTITATCSDATIVASVQPATETWCTVTVANKVATVKVSANATGFDRYAQIYITADGKSAVCKVTQLA